MLASEEFLSGFAVEALDRISSARAGVHDAFRRDAAASQTLRVIHSESEAVHMAERDEDDFVTVASYSEVGEAALAQSVLDGAGVDSFLSGEEANILLPMSGARLQVRLSDVDTARELLNTVPTLQDEQGTVSGATTEGAALADNGDEL